MKYILCVAVFIATPLFMSAQVGIGTTNPDPSAALHLVTSTTVNQGFLIPRMSTTNRDTNIKSPRVGILIFNTTNSEFQVSTANSGWVSLGTYATAVTAAGTTTFTGKLGIGTTAPDPNSILDVSSTTKGVLLPLLGTDPASVAGMIYYNSSTNRVRGYNGTSWTNLN